MRKSGSRVAVRERSYDAVRSSDMMSGRVVLSDRSRRLLRSIWATRSGLSTYFHRSTPFNLAMSFTTFGIGNIVDQNIVIDRVWECYRTNLISRFGDQSSNVEFSLVVLGSIHNVLNTGLCRFVKEKSIFSKEELIDFFVQSDLVELFLNAIRDSVFAQRAPELKMR